MERTPHILVVDDHADIRDLVSRFLVKEGYRASVAKDGREMMKALSDKAIDLILLDLMMPGEDGLSLCRRLRAESTVPVIMVTAKGDEIDRVIGLEMGADDYIAKPFNSREVIARIKAVLRRTSGEMAGGPAPAEASKRYHFAQWVFDRDKRELIDADGVATALSTGEYDLLCVLIDRPGRVLSREQLLDLARGRAAQAFDRSIDTQVSRLRRKIEPDPKNPTLIKTVWGGGYVFSADVTQA